MPSATAPGQQQQQQQQQVQQVQQVRWVLAAGLYVLSGVAQPLLMTLARDAGLTDPTAQLYMVFYQLGPATFIPIVWLEGTPLPTWPTRRRAMALGALDIVSQAMNYTGAAMAGPTLFAIIYSSVTVWTAVLSRVVLGRTMALPQWLAVSVVFGGLTITAFNSVAYGPGVLTGSLLVLVGSALHSATYVLSEAIMTRGREPIPVRMNLALQGVMSFGAFAVWQMIYTLPRYQRLIADPVAAAGTSLGHAAEVLVCVCVCVWFGPQDLNGLRPKTPPAPCLVCGCDVARVDVIGRGGCTPGGHLRGKLGALCHVSADAQAQPRGGDQCGGAEGATGGDGVCGHLTCVLWGIGETHRLSLSASDWRAPMSNN
jgi:drug/metabolite transporter (DMT)-like permease